MVTFADRFTRGLFFASVLALCAGCAGVQSVMNDVSTAFDAPAPAAEREAAPTYCYRTLGKVSCYSQPLPASEANRLVGYQGPAPRASSGTGPLSP